jgi:hypothetical protein
MATPLSSAFGLKRSHSTRSTPLGRSLTRSKRTRPLRASVNAGSCQDSTSPRHSGAASIALENTQEVVGKSNGSRTRCASPTAAEVARAAVCNATPTTMLLRDPLLALRQLRRRAAWATPTVHRRSYARGRAGARSLRESSRSRANAPNSVGARARCSAPARASLRGAASQSRPDPRLRCRWKPTTAEAGRTRGNRYSIACGLDFRGRAGNANCSKGAWPGPTIQARRSLVNQTKVSK